MHSHAYPFHNLAFSVQIWYELHVADCAVRPSKFYLYVISTADIVAMRINAVETTL
jgi:hypothetical protein